MGRWKTKFSIIFFYFSKSETGTSAMMSSKGFPMPKMQPSLETTNNDFLSLKPPLSSQRTSVSSNLRPSKMKMQRNKKKVSFRGFSLLWSIFFRPTIFNERKKRNSTLKNAIFCRRSHQLNVLWIEIHSHAFVSPDRSSMPKRKNSKNSKKKIFSKRRNSTSCFLISSSQVLIFFSIWSRISPFDCKTNLEMTMKTRRARREVLSSFYIRPTGLNIGVFSLIVLISLSVNFARWISRLKPSICPTDFLIELWISIIFICNWPKAWWNQGRWHCSSRSRLCRYFLCFFFTRRWTHSDRKRNNRWWWEDDAAGCVFESEGFVLLWWCYCSIRRIPFTKHFSLVDRRHFHRLYWVFYREFHRQVTSVSLCDRVYFWFFFKTNSKRFCFWRDKTQQNNSTIEKNFQLRHYKDRERSPKTPIHV